MVRLKGPARDALAYRAAMFQFPNGSIKSHAIF